MKHPVIFSRWIPSLAALLLCVSTANTVNAQKPGTEVKILKDANDDPILFEFGLLINGLSTPFDISSVFLLPGESANIQAINTRGETEFDLYDTAQQNHQAFTKAIEWVAPSTHGHYPLKVISRKTGHTVTINAFVKVPASQVGNGKIGKFRVGSYPSDKEIKNKALYVVPDGYIEVTETLRSIKLSPSFTLGEFVSKQSSGYPKYVYLRERLIVKLEYIKRELNRQAINAEKIVVMSGYRTPFYNKSIGNVKFSRHVFGDAADIFIDNNNDYYMDDITGDKKRDYKDAKRLADIIEKMSTRESFQAYVGGIGIYGPKPHRGPFVHVDTRGYKARWTKP